MVIRLFLHAVNNRKVYYVYMAILYTLIGACKNNKQLIAQNPSYLEIYVANSESDSSHGNAIIDHNGLTWYIGNTPAFNLNAFLYDRAIPALDRDADNNTIFGINLFVKPEYDAILSSWTKKHIGEYIAIIIKNEHAEHVYVDKLHAEIRTIFRIQGFRDKETLSRIYETITSGGI